MLIQADLGTRPPALREVVGAGEPLNPEIIEQVQHRWGLTLRDRADGGWSEADFPELRT